MPAPTDPVRRSSTSLVDVLDRVLDKGLVVAGDIKVSLAEVELLTIRIRLLVCSIDKAQEIGLDWWRHDHHFSGTARDLVLQNERLQERVRMMEQQIAAITAAPSARSASRVSHTKEDR